MDDPVVLAANANAPRLGAHKVHTVLLAVDLRVREARDDGDALLGADIVQNSFLLILK